MTKSLQFVPISLLIVFISFKTEIFTMIPFQETPQHYVSSRVISNRESIINLPIEVLGREGTIESRSFILDENQANSAQNIWLLINNLSYENKGSVKINDGDWLPLNHSTTTINSKELAYGGMTHGGFNTIRLKLSSEGLVAGNNTLSFKFDKSDGISNVLSMTQYEHDNPLHWEAPENSSEQRGGDLWFGREGGDLWNRYELDGGQGFWYAYNGTDRPAFSPERRQIKAKCTDCHTSDGRDLEMFSYSNRSIIERAKFHGLSEQDGKDIAAYIRGLSSIPNVGRYGRPWNPPYQPGPILKDKSIEEWAAGAGIEWVLEEDADMAPYLFGETISKESVLNYFNSNAMDDRTVIPVAIQFPDWKHWLPIVHPMDAFSKNNYIHNQGTKPLAATTTFLNWVRDNRASTTTFTRNFIGRHRDWYQTFRNFFANGSSAPRHWRTLFDHSPAYQHLSNGMNAEIAATSLARLMAVKNFEVMTTYDLQDKAEWFVDSEDHPGNRQWPTRKYNVFEVPPHFTGLAYDNNSDSFEGQPKVVGRYESTNWYGLQFVLNGGNGLVGGTTPADFNYLNEFIGKSIQSSGIDEPLRYFSTVNQMYQIRNWSGNTGPDDESGYRIRNQGPFIFVGLNHQNSAWYGKANPERIFDPLNVIHPELSSWVIDGLLQQFLDEMNKPKNSIATWPRNQDDTWSGKEIEFMLDRETISTLRDLPNTGLYQGHFAAKMFYTMQRLSTTSVSCEVYNEVIDWCYKAWPNVTIVGNTTYEQGFNSLKKTGCNPEPCDIGFLQAGDQYRIKTVHHKCMNEQVYEGFQVTQQTCNANDNGNWILENADLGFYFIKNAQTGQYLQITGVNNGDPLTTSTFTGDASQQWKINILNTCNYNIISKSANKCVDLKSGQSADGTHFQLWTCSESGSSNREFIFEKIDILSVDTLNQDISNILVYPNPTDSLVFFEINAPQYEDHFNIEVYNALGIRVISESAVTSSFQLDFELLATGPYFVTISNQKQQFHTTVLKR